MSQVRVRFAPSPTGFLHVGGARTAIFNWLYARRHGGVFVLRIEDTDHERSSEPMVQAILDGMHWLGMEPDEGPFYQSRARERHVADARLLLERGLAYRCFRSPEEIRQERDAAQKAGRDYVVRGVDRDVDEDEARRRADAGEPFALRFKMPGGRTEWDDQVHRATSFDNDTIEDFVIVRSDGTPTYMLSVVSDDIDMGITHVIRGDDHLSNTPKQILLYRALEREVPAFAHLPLILGEDKKRLSKRHGALSVLEYRDDGYLPEAMFNFLALLGWSPGDDRQKLDRAELIEAFDLKGVSKSGAVFDLKKLEWLNGEYLAAMEPEALALLVKPHLQAAGLWRDTFDGEERGLLLGTLALLRSRVRRPDDFVERGRPYLDLSDELAYDPQAAKKHLKGDGIAENLEALLRGLEAADPWSEEPLEQALRAVAEARGLSAGKLIHPTRLAVTGMGVSPGIFEVLVLLGRERSLCRLRRMVDHVRSRPAP